MTDDKTQYKGDDRLAYVHMEKTAWQAVSALEDAGLARLGRGEDFQWVGMHPKLARTYVAALAQQVASDNSLTPITDQKGAAVGAVGDIEWLASTLLSVSSGRDRSPGSLLVLGISHAIPAGLEKMSWEKIIRLRTELNDELKNFRHHVDAFEPKLAELVGVVDETRAREHLSDLREEAITRPLSDLEEKLKELSGPVKTTWQFLLAGGSGVGVAKAVDAMGWSSGTHEVGALVVAAGVAYGISGRRKAIRDEVSASPVGYLYQLRRATTPASQMHGIMANLRTGWL